MCDTCNIQTYTRVQKERYDPTRTLTLRTSFVADFKRRFVKLTRIVQESIVGNDCFGLSNSLSVNMANAAGRNQFDHPTNAEKVAAFMLWFNSQVEAIIFELELMQQMSSMWQNKYIFEGYKRGIQRGALEMQKIGMRVDAPTIEQMMRTSLHMEALDVLYNRVFTNLKEITVAMEHVIRTVLAEGLANGDSAKKIADKLVAAINGKGLGDLGITDSLGRFIPAQRRAETLARTEIVRAHHRATINQYRSYSDVGVYIMAEILTAGDNQVCPACNALEGNFYTLDEAMNLVPQHPNCRCIALPYEVIKT